MILFEKEEDIIWQLQVFNAYIEVVRVEEKLNGHK